LGSELATCQTCDRLYAKTYAACPHCSWSNRAAGYKGARAGAWIGIGLVGLFVLGLVATVLALSATPPSTAESAAGDTASAPPQPIVPPPPKPVQSAQAAQPESKWVYRTTTDEMRGTTSKFASIESENWLSFGFPYSGGAARLLIRQRPQDGLSVILTVQGQFLCNSFSNDTVAVKFDDGPIRLFGCSEPTDGSTGQLFINSERSFVERLKKSKKLVIEAQFYQEGPKQMTFDVSGLSWK
jgi:hypothetical protein